MLHSIDGVAGLGRSLLAAGALGLAALSLAPSAGAAEASGGGAPVVNASMAAPASPAAAAPGAASAAPAAAPAEVATASVAPGTVAGAATPAPPIFLDPPFERVPAVGKAIFVNIPSYELIAFEDGKEVLRSRVIVGSPKNPTPDLTATTSVVRFRPTWTPTPDMIKNEGLSPETRPPGRRNPLGLLAIRLDPGMLIYLHDTNNRKLFNRDKRALSHGCIRVEKWDEAAAFVLGIPVEEVHEYANGRRTFDMDTTGVPVIVRYNTEFPDSAGNMQKYADVYGREARYAKTLKSKPPKPSFAWDTLPTSWATN